jgi:hypothetical protein
MNNYQTIPPVKPRDYPKMMAHIIIWALIFSFIALAPSLYPKIFLTKGKPVMLQQVLPESTDQIYYNIENLVSKPSDGIELHFLNGWAFNQLESDQSPYDRWIVLRSNTKILYFPVKSVDRADVQKAFAELELDLIKSGFSATLSKYFIPRGTYKIGILFKHRITGATYYTDTPRILTRTPNQLLLEPITP